MLGLRSMTRFLLLTLALCMVPASSNASVFISVGFAPPQLPVYVQPPCTDPGLIWVPGYWAYGGDGYYWVPGAWVPAPYYGALWTPPYWGWQGGLYIFHPGYWGREVGYYGGVNYGFGYFGIGFVGGRWNGNHFYYNRAVWHVDGRRIHNVYDDHRDWSRYRVSRDSRVSYSGGPGGIRYSPSAHERSVMREQHTSRTSFQQQHDTAARNDRNAYFRNNDGRPSNAAATRPLGVERHGAPNNMKQNRPGAFDQGGPARAQYQPQPRQIQQGRTNYENRGEVQSRQAPRYQRPQNQHQQGRPQFDARPQYQQRPQAANQRFEMQQQRSEPQVREQRRGNVESRPVPAPREQHQPERRGNPHR